MSILSLFRNEFNKFNYTGGRILRFYLSCCHDVAPGSKTARNSHFFVKN